jgi:hypothetical protein
LACAQAAKPPVPTPGLHLQQQRAAVVVGGMWHAGCGLCEVVRLFFNLNFDVAPLSLRLAKTDSPTYPYQISTLKTEDSGRRATC